MTLFLGGFSVFMYVVVIDYIHRFGRLKSRNISKPILYMPLLLIVFSPKYWLFAALALSKVLPRGILKNPFMYL